MKINDAWVFPLRVLTGEGQPGPKKGSPEVI